MLFSQLCVSDHKPKGVWKRDRNLGQESVGEALKGTGVEWGLMKDPGMGGVAGGKQKEMEIPRYLWPLVGEMRLDGIRLSWRRTPCWRK